MKYCPQCHKQYTENWITFCSDDGTILIDTGYLPNQQAPTPGSQRPYSTPYAEPPTWRSPDPNAPGGWVSPDQSTPTPAPAWQPPRPPAVYPRSQQTNGLATASMILGIIGLFVGFCLGPLPGIAALILGLVAINQIKKVPQNGRPLAIAGIVTGSLSLLFYGMLFIFWIIGAILSH